MNPIIAENNKQYRKGYNDAIEKCFDWMLKNIPYYTNQDFKKMNYKIGFKKDFFNDLKIIDDDTNCYFNDDFYKP